MFFAEELAYQIKQTNTKLVIADDLHLSTTLDALTLVSNNVVSSSDKPKFADNDFGYMLYIGESWLLVGPRRFR